MAETPKGWQLLHSKLPSAAIKPLATSVYGVAGLSDVNEGFLIQRLFASGLIWDWVIVKQEYLGFEDKTSQGGKDYRVYMAAVHGVLRFTDEVQPGGGSWWAREFHGSGASDNRKLDAAYKGAATVAFKNACKLAGLTAELFLDGRAIDHIYSERVRKDPEMAHASVDAAYAEITETYGDPAERTEDERSGKDRNVASATAPLPAMTPPSAQKAQEPPMALPPDLPAVDAAPKTNGVGSSSSEPEDRQPLYVLARTLKIPRTVLEVDNKIAKQGIGAVRLELVLAHARDHGAACIHVAELAGLR